MNRVDRFPLLVALLASCICAVGQNPAAVYTFQCGISNNYCPNGAEADSIMQGSDGNFYGTAQVTSEISYSGGSVFSLTPSGKFRVLSAAVDFPQNISEGPDGMLYGETSRNFHGLFLSASLFRLAKDGSKFQVVHTLCSKPQCVDGTIPTPMVAGTDGNLYGTTLGGGSLAGGTIFRVTSSTRAFKTVVNFIPGATGQNPSALVVASDGTFYGTTGGSTGAIMFHYVEATGTLTTKPLHFPLVNGNQSAGSVSIIGPNGNFYGLYTVSNTSGIGIFEVPPGSSRVQLFPFYSTATLSGSNPEGLVLGSDGNFWMAEFYGGINGVGDIVVLSPTDGRLVQTLSPFSSIAAIGGFPTTLVRAKDKTLWGTTFAYGKASRAHYASGGVFRLN